ncbi:metalloprotease, partial [Coemansia sp. RSA 552]
MQYRLHFGALFVAICLGLYRWYGGPQASWSTGFAARRTASHLPYEEFTGTLEQSPTDPRTHRLIRLPNGMVAACVHDPDAANAAAALSVNVGAFSDPPELMGLAHFLEHMLFLGTRKYPAEDEYVAYINGNSGKYNAFTALDTTAYFFEVANGALEGALDRFSQFFIDPLFTPDGVGRELNAVDSEHKGNLQSDGRRLFQLQRLLSRSTHPYSKFSTGNKDTLLGSSQRLGLDIRDEVVRFYNQRYSADIMRFAIVGNYSVEQLVEWTVAQLSSVQSKGDTREKMPVHPLGPNDLGKLVYYETVENKTTLSLQFGLPELKRTYRTMPSRYVASLVRRKTPGSVFHLLKEKGWATNIQADIHSLAYDGFNMFDIDIDLTPAGLEHHEDVLRAVLAYLAMLANSGPQKWIHDELRTMRKLEFQFFEKPG